jgi:hypothetical protein
MQEIADWLTRLGLPEYAGAFAENGIDVSVLPHLTDQDLKDIGVLLGHRRKILAAVAELPGKSPSASKPFPPVVEARDRHTTEPPQPAPVAPPPTEAMGERRHVTVMFCDLVDSTGIAAKLDAEQWRDLRIDYFDVSSKGLGNNSVARDGGRGEGPDLPSAFFNSLSYDLSCGGKER